MTSASPNEVPYQPQRWPGAFASFLLPGLGQFIQGRRLAGFAILFFAVLLPWLSGVLLLLPFIPAKLAVVSIGFGWIYQLYFICDAWRPTPKIGWRWLAVLIFLPIFGEIELTGLRTLFGVYSIPTGSMAPTFQPGDVIFTVHCAYWIVSPKRGDVVIFFHRDVERGTETFIKRLVGLPGDRLGLKGGVFTLNKVPYTYPGQVDKYVEVPEYDVHNYDSGNTYRGDALLNGTYVVPDDEFYVLGDNSENSMDSRYEGPYPMSSLCGKAIVIIWPEDRIHRIVNKK